MGLEIDERQAYVRLLAEVLAEQKAEVERANRGPEVARDRSQGRKGVSHRGGVLPLSLSLSDASARLIGAYVRLGLVDVVRPPLDTIDDQLRSVNRMLRVLTPGSWTDGRLQQRLRVQVMNEDLLDHVEAARWAIAYFSYNTFLELLDDVAYMRWLDGRSHIHLHQIIAPFVPGGSGGRVRGRGQRSVDASSSCCRRSWTSSGRASHHRHDPDRDPHRRSRDFLKTLDLWKLLGLLGLLALGLTLIVAFLFGVGAALATFGAGVLAAAAIGVLVVALIPLMRPSLGSSGKTWPRSVRLSRHRRVRACAGQGVGTVTADLEKIVLQLERFFTAISKR